ncbi:MAG: phosphotransferase [Pirellulales bacterium]
MEARIMARADAVREHPDFPWLSLDDPAGLEAFLKQRGWIASAESVRGCEKPGEGNMNLTIRVRTDRRSMIVKQARPWVEKYDHIPAPWDRIQYEIRFYERIARIPAVANRMPRLLGVDTEACALILEDLAGAQSLASLYSGEALAEIEVRHLAEYLGALHQATRGPVDPAFKNWAMRQLNHQHIFEVPLAENNGLDLEQFECGLTAAAEELRHDAVYRGLIRYAGERYLGAGHVLVHGDFFPGSWLRTSTGIFVIDPEFCFYGDAEFDLGCAIAHLRFAQQPRECAEVFLQAYAEHPGTGNFQSSLLTCFAAAEVMRRLIGVAQLPLGALGVSRAELLDRSRRAIIDQSWEELWN